MGTLDEIRKSFGPTALERTTGPGTGPHHWVELCVCGHLTRHHSPSVGGEFELQPLREQVVSGGRTVQHTQVFDGCRGAVVNRGQVTSTDVIDREADPITHVETFLATCPCTEFRPVAKVDRPNRFFNQRIPRPTDREDPMRHPFMVGIRAFNTFLSRRRMALSDPSWAEAEFERRFVWTARRCALSQCHETDDVFPVFINEDTSELRCPAHR